jgi:hypothetical protein
MHQVLQHIADPVQGLTEIRRVIKRGRIVAARESAGMTWYPENVRLQPITQLQPAFRGRRLRPLVRANHMGEPKPGNIIRKVNPIRNEICPPHFHPGIPECEKPITRPSQGGKMTFFPEGQKIPGPRNDELPIPRRSEEKSKIPIIIYVLLEGLYVNNDILFPANMYFLKLSRGSDNDLLPY